MQGRAAFTGGSRCVTVRHGSERKEKRERGVSEKTHEGQKPKEEGVKKKNVERERCDDKLRVTAVS